MFTENMASTHGEALKDAGDVNRTYSTPMSWHNLPSASSYSQRSLKDFEQHKTEAPGRGEPAGKPRVGR